MVTQNKTINRLLSLVLCLCMVLTLLPMIPMEAEAASTITVYFENNWKWSKVNIYYWGSKTSTNPAWPGKTMTKTANNGTYDYYVFEVPADVTGIIFNNGSAQTVDIKSGWYDGICYYMQKVNNQNQVGTFNICYNFPDKHAPVKVSGYAATCTKSGLTDGTKCTICNQTVTAQKKISPKGHSLDGDTCTVCGVGYMTIYFENNWLWSDVKLYYWYGENNALYNKPHPGELMTLYDNNGEHDFYVMKVPTDVKGIQFNGIKDDGSGTLDKIDITSGWKTGLCYSMLYVNGQNTVKTFDINTVDFSCKHKNVVNVPGSDATCTATGLTAGTKCADCGEPVKAQTVIPALGHDWSDATCDAPKTCSVCGATEGVALGHSYKNDCDATCDICGDIREVGEHLYVYGCDTICYMCNEVTRPDAAHVSNMYPCCDGVCRYGCGTQMPATGEHTYDNACDFECNVCYGHREVPDHVYDNACDAKCNICGDDRWVPGHSYDGDCDTDCNICGDVREPGEHRYLHSCDTNCFVCDKLTRPGATHLSDYPCKAGACLFGCGTEVPASSDHNWNCYYEQAPNCGFDGVYYYQCLSCGDRYEECPPATGEHTYANNCDTTCFVCGKLTRPEAVHVSNTPSCKDGVCLYCGIVTPATEEHSYNSEVTDPDCVNGGYTTYTCSVCGDSYVADHTEALGHSYNSEVTEPDCVNGGYTTYTCACGHSYVADKTEALGHTDEAVPGYAADCTNTGLTDGSKCAVCGETLIAQEIIPATGIHADADKNYRCDSCNKLMQDAQLAKVSVSLKGNIAVNYYMLLTEEVAADRNAYMYFKLVDGEVKIPATDGVKKVLDGETYYVYTCAVSAKEMTDDILSQFFYAGGETKLHTYKIQTYAKHILANYDDAATKNLIAAMVNYGAASQVHFGYNTDDLANTGVTEAPDYSDVTIAGFNAVAGQGTDLAKFYSASLILKSETTVRFFFQVDSAASFTASYNGQELTVGKRSGLYYVDVVGISAKDLDEDVTITINDGTNSTKVSFNPMSYCQGVLNDTTGAFSNEMKDLVRALYLYNQAANVYFKEV